MYGDECQLALDHNEERNYKKAPGGKSGAGVSGFCWRGGVKSFSVCDPRDDHDHTGTDHRRCVRAVLE